jgi:non-specific serine/threonine protein kinase
VTGGAERDAVALPPEVSTFVGRQGLLADLRKLLLGDVRLVTATGVGGVGKTRLALRAAAELGDEADVRLVDLTGVSLRTPRGRS